jgi:hypothetical protein
VTSTCSQGRLAAGEPLAGTSPHARLWVLVEQPGPWGRDALVESRLPVEIGRALAAAADGRPARVGLIRSVGAHVDTGGGSRRLLVARTDAGRAWLASRRVDDVRSLTHLDVDALLDADASPTDLPGDPAPTPQRALLVCANAKRDQCCAVLGRPLAAALAQDLSGADTEVWETSHTGGHRFAPTFVSLPDGYLFGGPGAASGSVDACRGRSSLPPEAQVAELEVLRRLGPSVPRPLPVERGDDDDTWHVTVGGDVYLVAVRRHSGPERPESCGKPAVASSWLTASVHPTPRNV